MLRRAGPSRRRPRGWLARVAVAGIASLTAITAVVVPASAAHAAGNGNGWSAYWRYYSDTSFSFSATLPGVSLTGYGADTNGQRSSVVALLQDTSADGYCARGLMIGVGTGVADQTVCDGQPAKTLYLPNFTGLLDFFAVRSARDGSIKQSNFVVVPDSSTDAGIHTTGTGMSWEYTSSTNFQFDVARPGADFNGYGGSSVFGDTDRWALGTINRTAPGPTCAGGVLSDGSGNEKVGTACPPSTYGQVPFGSYQGAINDSACGATGCLTVSIPDPYDIAG